LVLYFLLENTALSITYASNVGIIVACAPFFVAVMVGIFFKEKQGVNFFIGFVIAITGVILISLSGEKNFHLNPLGDLKFLVFRLVCECTRFSFMESCYKLDRGSQNQSVYLCIPNRDGGTFAGDFT